MMGNMILNLLKNKYRYKITILLSKSYFEGLSRVSFSFCVDLEWSRTAKVAIFSDFNSFLFFHQKKTLGSDYMGQKK